jgi:hypothetical protein
MLGIIVALEVFVVPKAPDATTDMGASEREVMFLGVLAKNRYH